MGIEHAPESPAIAVERERIALALRAWANLTDARAEQHPDTERGRFSRALDQSRARTFRDAADMVASGYFHPLGEVLAPYAPEKR